MNKKQEKKFFELICVCNNQQQELERYKNIIDELEKHICKEWYCFDNESVEFEVARDILNKLKELKGE